MTALALQPFIAMCFSTFPFFFGFRPSNQFSKTRKHGFALSFCSGIEGIEMIAPALDLESLIRNNTIMIT